jgi:hypothetical protein
VDERKLNRPRKEAVAHERGGSQRRTLLAVLVFLSEQLKRSSRNARRSRIEWMSYFDHETARHPTGHLMQMNIVIQACGWVIALLC